MYILNKMRLQKFLSASGVSSRRQAEGLIKQGVVKVNNNIIDVMGVKVDPAKDKVMVYNKLVSLPKDNIYLMLDKPVNYITSARDEHGRQTVYDILPKKYKNLFSVGRLDKDSQGLLLLTDDGDFAQKLTHPSFNHSKEYLVRVNKKMTNDFITSLQKGVILDEGLARADKIIRVNAREFRIVLHQGWKRQIRRMVAELDYRVELLIRIRLANYSLEDMGGKLYKEVSKYEIIQ